MRFFAKPSLMHRRASYRARAIRIPRSARSPNRDEMSKRKRPRAAAQASVPPRPRRLPRPGRCRSSSRSSVADQLRVEATASTRELPLAIKRPPTASAAVASTFRSRRISARRGARASATQLVPRPASPCLGSISRVSAGSCPRLPARRLVRRDEACTNACATARHPAAKAKAAERSLSKMSPAMTRSTPGLALSLPRPPRALALAIRRTPDEGRFRASSLPLKCVCGRQAGAGCFPSTGTGPNGSGRGEKSKPLGAGSSRSPSAARIVSTARFWPPIATSPARLASARPR